MIFSSLKRMYGFLLLVSCISCFGQSLILSKNARASVITCDTGNESYSLFGHTAIRISDLENNFDVVYNYGAFDFSTPNFVAKFAKGDLQYFAAANTFSDFMNQYSYEHRSVFEQELNIPWTYKQKLFENLTAVVSSSESYYTYKFIDKNCTSMVVEILNKTLGSKIIINKVNNNQTYRSILFPYFDHFFYEKLGTSIIFGSKVDENSNHIFLPLDLYKSLNQTQFQHRRLCFTSKKLLDFQKQIPHSWWNTVYSYLIFLGLILILNKNYVDTIYLFIVGLLGIFFCTMGLYSFHEELAYNYNALLFNPMLLILLVCMLMGNKKWVTRLATINLIFIAVYLIVLLPKIHLTLLLPLIFTNSFILSKIIYKCTKV